MSRQQAELLTPGGPADAPGTAAVFSGPIVTGTFRVAGLTWDADADLAPGTEIHLRVRENGVWSDWLDTPDEQAADSRSRHGTAPFVTGGADAVQVHNNFLVDKYGTVFEGRYGSIAAPDGRMRVGAHAQGYNTYSMAISAMGDYSNIATQQLIMDRMRDVIAWRFSRTPTLDMATQALFPANAYHPTDRYLPRIFGHRDVLATVCPGNDIESRIPALITAVNTAMGGAPLPNTAPVANAGPDKTVRAGATVTLTGTATDADGDPMSSYLWAQTPTPTVTLKTPTTAKATFTAPTVPKGMTSVALTFTFTVTDTDGATGTDTVVVKVVRK